MTLDEPAFKTGKAYLEEVGVGTKEKPTRRLSDVRCRALGKRLAHEFREAPWILQSEWWAMLHRIFVGEALISHSPASSTIKERDRDLFLHCGLGPDWRWRRAAARIPLRVFLRAAPEDQLDIIMYALHARPHPAAWYAYAWLNTWRPAYRWAQVKPTWDINTSWSDTPREYGERTLHWACLYGDPETVRFLLAAGAQVILTDQYGRAPLHVAVQSAGCARSSHKAAVRIADLLLAHGADIDAQDRGGESPLFYASSIEVARFLIESGANPDLLSESGHLFSERYSDDSEDRIENGWRCLSGEYAVNKVLQAGARNARVRI